MFLFFFFFKEQKEQLDLLRIRFEQLYRELNQYRQKNSDLNIEIKKIKEQSFNDSRSIYSMNDEYTLSKLRKSYNNEIEKLTFKLNDIEDENIKLKELLKQNGNDLQNRSIGLKLIKENKELIKSDKKDNNYGGE